MAAVDERAWDMLPAAALVSIFRKLGVRDRFLGGPLVCRSWNEASRNPRCWESMLPEAVCPVFQFIMRNGDNGIFPPPERLPLLALRAFIERSGGGATTLYISRLGWRRFVDDDILFFIAQRCPKLKDLSLRGCRLYSEAGLLKLVQCCRELKLLDLGFACPLSLAVLQEMGRCWPELQGLRRQRDFGPGEVSAIATSFPKLQFLNLHFSDLNTHDLSTILKSCTCLRFLDVTFTVCSDFYRDKELSNMVARIPQFLYNDMSKRWGYVVDDDFTERFRVQRFHEDSDDD